MLTQKDNNLNKTITYTYDEAGNRETMTDGEAGLTNYTYDNVNRLTKITNPDNDETDFTYDDAGNLTRKDYANGAYTIYDYDDVYNILLLSNMKSTGETISSFTYTYDDVGNRLSKIYANGDTELYTYDNLYQLTKVESKDRIAEYEYDKVGNRLQMIENGDTTVYSYNTDNQLISYNKNDADSISFIYDANGNQIVKSTQSDTYTYVYSNENNLVKISAVNDTNVISYIYSPVGKRLKKIVNTVGTKYFYEENNVLAEYDTNTTVKVRYTNNLAVDDIISSKRNGVSEWYHKDALGSIINLTNNNEDTIISYIYSPFGLISSKNGNSDNDMMYAGRKYDEESSLYFLRSRYYSPDFGRFIKKDKVYLELLFRESDIILKTRKIFPLYLYVNNNPVNRIDPFGLYSLNSAEQELYDEAGYWELLGLYNSKSEAEDAAAQSKYDGTQRNGPGDAVRHCVWNCEMTQRNSEEFAEEWGCAHEEDTPEDEADEKEMDLHNNKAGRDLATFNPSGDCTDMCESALDIGLLEVLDESEWE